MCWIKSDYWFAGSHWLNVCVSPKFLYWNLIPKVIVFGGLSFGKWLGHEGRALVNAISALIKDYRELSWPFCHVNHKAGSYQTTDRRAPWACTYFLGSRTGRNKFLLFYKPLIGSLLQQPEYTMTQGKDCISKST